jgi:hypothetical protein
LGLSSIAWPCSVAKRARVTRCPTNLEKLCTEVRKVSRSAVRWFTVRRAWLLLVRMGRRKYARTRKSLQERGWTLLKQQAEAMIQWCMSKWKQHTCDTALRDLHDWLVERYGEGIHIMQRDHAKEHYMFQATNPANRFDVGILSSNGQISLWIHGVPTRSHLSYVTDDKLILPGLPDTQEGSSVLVKLDIDEQDQFHCMKFTRTTCNHCNGHMYLVSSQYLPKHRGYFKVVLRTVLDLGRVDSGEALTPFQPA